VNRPQFQYSTPPGFKDVPYKRPVSVGQDNTGSIAAGGYVWQYAVNLDTDAHQRFRSLFWQGQQQGQGATATAGSLQIQMRDGDGLYLTDGFIPIWLFCWGAGSTPPDGGSGRAKVFEPELVCRAGGQLLIDFFNPDGANYVYPGYFELCGVKRWPVGCV
jgi:hypothetical protein